VKLTSSSGFDMDFKGIIPQSLVKYLNTAPQPMPRGTYAPGAHYARPDPDRLPVGDLIRELDPTFTVPRGVSTLRDVDYGAIKDFLTGKYQISDDPRASLQRAGSAVLGMGEGALDALPLAVLAKPAVKAVKAAAPALAKEGVRRLTGLEEKYGLPTSPTMNIIKPEGGNWLDNGDFGVTRQLAIPFNTMEETAKVMDKYGLTIDELTSIPVKERMGMYDEFLTPENRNAIAHNTWIDSTLTKYIKQRMGTQSDEIRKLAEEGITHFEPAGPNMPRGSLAYYANAEDPPILSLGIKRINAGFPEEGVGKSTDARSWEATTDYSIRNSDLGDVVESMKYKGKEPESWMLNAEPSTKIHALTTSVPEAFGFDKISDSIMEGLESGALRPENLNRLSLEDAARLTHKSRVDKELASGEALRNKMAAMTQVKQYDDGTRIVKLDKPGQFADESDQMSHSVRGYEPYEGHPDYAEGMGNDGSRSYGHGGWDAIKSGEAEVYSVKDKDGKSLATIEVSNNKKIDSIIDIPDDVTEHLHQQAYEDAHAGVLHSAEDVSMNDVDDIAMENYLSLAYDWINANNNNMGKRITQIKGPGNSALNKEALPAVQDFVKTGEWDDVKDLRNAEVARLPNGKFYSYGEVREGLAKALEDPNSPLSNVQMERWTSSPEEFASHVEGFKDRVWPNYEKFFAAGGLVVSDYDEEHIDRLSDEIFNFAEGGEVEVQNFAGGGLFKGLRKLVEPTAQVVKKAPESHPFIGYLSKDGKMEKFNETQAKEADYHHSNLVKNLDAYDSDDSLKFVRNGSENVYSIRGNAAIMPHATASKEQLSRLAKRLVNEGADPNAPFSIEHMSLPETEAPYQGKSIGTLKQWIEGTHGFAEGGKVTGQPHENEYVKAAGKFSRKTQGMAASLIPGLRPILDKAQDLPLKYYAASGEHNGEADAMRHMLLQAQLMQKYGETPAKVIGWLHENVSFGQPEREQAMDEYNDILGREIGAKARSEQEMIDMARQYISSKKAKSLKQDDSPDGYARGGLVYNSEEINNLADQLLGA
jgi:hypothetical protein